jgi:hypothetical protein
MCGPAAILPLASLAITAVSAGAQYMGQRQAAQDQSDYQAQQVKERDRQIAENYKRSMAAYNLQNVAENVRMDEVRAAASQEAFRIAQASAQAKARVISNAAQTGAGGNSLLSVIQDIMGRAGFETNTVLGNLKSEEGQSYRNLQAFHEEATNRITSLQPYTGSTVRGPSLLGPALTIGGGALNSYSDYRRDQQISKLVNRQNTSTLTTN